MSSCCAVVVVLVVVFAVVVICFVLFCLSDSMCVLVVAVAVLIVKFVGVVYACLTVLHNTLAACRQFVNSKVNKYCIMQIKSTQNVNRNININDTRTG